MVGTWQEGIGSMKSADWFCLKAHPSRGESGTSRITIHPGRWDEREEASDQIFFVRIDCPRCFGRRSKYGHRYGCCFRSETHTEIEEATCIMIVSTERL